MPDFTLSKKQFADEMQATVRQLLLLLETLDNLNAGYSVHKFDTGDTNAFVDADFAASNSQLSAAIVADTMFAIGTIVGAASTGVRNSLRECLVGALP